MGEAREVQGSAPRGVVLGIALASMGMLTLQVSLTRVFSLLVWYHFAFLAVALALLGFTAGGVIVEARPKLLEGDVAAKLARTAWASSVATILAMVLAAKLPFGASVVADAKQVAIFAALVLSLMVPFVLSGIVVAATLAAHRQAIARLYFADLVGSGVGCLVSLVVMDHLGGGTGGVLFAAVLFAIAGVVFARASADRSLRARGAVLVPVALALVLLAANPLRPPFYLSNAKLYPRVPRELIIKRTCTSLACVDFFANAGHFGLWGISKSYKGPLPTQIGVVIDAWALTSILRADRAPDGTPIMQHPSLEALPPSVVHHFLRATGKKNSDVLVIGAGGGLDIRTALHFRASHVDAVEINPAIARAVGTEFDVFAGGLYHRPDVNLQVAEGRHWMRRASRQWDVLQISGVDTYAASQAGAFALTENYLYTVEAFREYFAHLRDDGTLTLTRWLYKPPRQTLRLCVIADQALRELGLGDAGPRMVVISAPVADSELDFSVVLLRKSPFTPGELSAIRRIADLMQFDVVWSPDGLSPKNAFSDYFAAPDRAAYVAQYPYRIEATTDDAPFFFEHNRFSRVLQSRDFIFGAASGPLVLLVTLGIVLALAAILAFLPRGRTDARLATRFQVYFLALGIGYVAAELAFVPKFVLYLGHPSHALSIVLFALLVSSGIGSALSPRVVTSYGRLAVVAVAIALVLSVEQIALPRIFDATLGLPFFARGAMAVLLVALPGTLMGMPFPAALSLGAAPSVPRAWVLNGCASVVATVLSMVIAISSGFVAVVALAAGCYALAALVAFASARIESA